MINSQKTSKTDFGRCKVLTSKQETDQKAK